MKAQLQWLALICASILLVSCAASRPAPVEIRGVDAPSISVKASTVSKPGKCKAGAVVAEFGDTLYAIARRCNVPLRALIHINNLMPPYTITVGQQLILPTVRTHTVLRSETLYGISRIYGVDLAQLVRLNNIQEPFFISAGQVLALPMSGAATDTSAVQIPATDNKDRLVPTPKPKVVKTEPIITKSFDQQIPRRRPTALTTVKEIPTGTMDKSADIPHSNSQKLSFDWPVKGRVVSRFGPKAGGQHNDGINIAAPVNAPIRAAEAGTVVYAGDGLKGFGNLLLIRHRNGFVTAYAHTSRILVERGETVMKGQVVARVGRSGNVKSPQVHFEVRKGSRAINPKELLNS